MKVSVVCDPNNSYLCWIDVVDRIKVGHNNSPMIRWEIVTSGYTFVGSGIWFFAGAPFDCHSEGKTKVACKDTNEATQNYKYTVTVIGWPPVFPNDPWVDNL